MFTGLVREIGKVDGIARTAGGARLSVSLGGLAAGTKVGDSVAVSGVCLTVAELSGDVAAFDVVDETLKRTTLGKLTSGAKVNLEPAVRVGEPLGGHFVTGHVDGVATCRSRREVGEGAEVTFELADALHQAIEVLGGEGVALGLVQIDGGNAGNLLARWHVAGDGGFARGLHAVADLEMPGHADLPAEDDVVAHVHGPGDPHE